MSGYTYYTVQGVDGLKGRLKSDFDELLRQHRLQIAQDERDKHSQTLENEKDAIIEEFTRQQEHIGNNSVYI